MVCSPGFPSNSNLSTFLIVAHTASFFTFLAWSWRMSRRVVVKVYRCVVAAGTIRFIFRLCYSVICVGLIGALRCWYRFLLSFISCVFLVSSWREDWRIFELLPPRLSIFSFVLVNPLYFVPGLLLHYDAGTNWVCFTSYTFILYSWRAARCVDTALPLILPCLFLWSWKFVQRGLLWRHRCYSAIFTFFVVFVLIFREDLIGALMPRLPSVFLLFSCKIS